MVSGGNGMLSQGKSIFFVSFVFGGTFLLRIVVARIVLRGIIIVHRQGRRRGRGKSGRQATKGTAVGIAAIDMDVTGYQGVRTFSIGFALVPGGSGRSGGLVGKLLFLSES